MISIADMNEFGVYRADEEVDVIVRLVEGLVHLFNVSRGDRKFFVQNAVGEDVQMGEVEEEVGIRVVRVVRHVHLARSPTVQRGNYMTGEHHLHFACPGVHGSRCSSSSRRIARSPRTSCTCYDGCPS